MYRCMHTSVGGHQLRFGQGAVRASNGLEHFLTLLPHHFIFYLGIPALLGLQRTSLGFDIRSNCVQQISEPLGALLGALCFVSGIDERLPLRHRYFAVVIYVRRALLDAICMGLYQR